ncbi:hypothetical protein ABB37_05652 [Leptomonas pyrrhocoris]|uniref:A-kinase anchor protein 7-like phosphoesterase domain-containing protein n=1 Tax=Leptomonas pyrrhocoris TaxID=157538 RepID=A0A0N0VES1_LEPPY|nr:hypothetical protein ABB37_05652 [Leptomonas pyrrhocoris]XP_015657584.1 hypothetical protein ABB37_05652 [Leptomonas pyrrhocoris]KPA79144.1 hypothetical protein ABB37_05652 [Leptomonas pyrrhocoris]KPA79145.1 hypothetical protein ABB37_05652 [Leptomonas pyrrhocoris]|eukprot:XP_015657583.1 hypothetical protein ABB37_05652 [Leptomonas pyrrhocoris]
MAHLIAPPSSVQPMTKEDVAVVQAEKRVDAATREQLVSVYGDSRDPHGRPIDLTRPPHRNWRCPSCGKVSTDLRHVCGFCLQPEPGYTSQRCANRKGETANDARRTAATTATATAVQRAGTSSDAGVQFLQISSTKRTYRVFTEPHLPTAASRSTAARGATKAADMRDAMKVEEGDEDEEDGVWDDEPGCGEGQPCRPGDGGGRDSDEEAAAAAGGGGGAAPTAKVQRRAPKEEKVDGGFTHFVSIPVGKLPAITANATRVLEDLRSFVGAEASPDHAESAGAGAEDTGDVAAPSASSSKTAATPDLVTSTPQLHMTLLMLSLPSREDVEFAKELLQGPFAAAWAAVKEKAVAALKNKSSNSSSSNVPTLLLSGDASLAPAHRHPLIRLGGGLQVMKAGEDNELYQPQKASVVYMGIDDPAALATVQQLQRVLHDSFAELIQDLAEAARARRVLHVTIMNKKWRQVRGARRPFDARPILDVFQEACIGAGDDGTQLFEIPELELCARRRHDDETGTYFAEAVVKI